jgi:hypothetical protein
MPFLPLIWVSYGMNPTNSTYSSAVGSGTNRGLYAAPCTTLPFCRPWLP